MTTITDNSKSQLFGWRYGWRFRLRLLLRGRGFRIKKIPLSQMSVEYLRGIPTKRGWLLNSE